MPLTRKNLILKLGYVPLIDSAPLLVAQEEGFFKEEGVEVCLREEIGWATVRDKLIHGELDMASCLMGLPYALNNGVGCFKTEMTIPLILCSSGNSITLSSDFTIEQVNSSSKFAESLNSRAKKYERKWTFATVNPYSTHLILLFQWLNNHLKDYIGEFEIVFIPPQLCPELLEQGMIDGFCAGEPWGTIAEEMGAGWGISSSKTINPNHLDKVLAVPKRTMDSDEEVVKKVGRALIKSCEKCQDSDYEEKLISVLSESLKIRTPDINSVLEKSLSLNSGNTTSHLFFGSEVNNPTAKKEQWLLKGLKQAGLFRKKVIATGQIMNSDLLFP